jgi:hypothetical protein
MNPRPKKQPVPSGRARGGKAIALATHVVKSRSLDRTTLEDRLEAKAARGDRTDYNGPSLDEMTREQRHKLLYGA